VLKPRLLRPQAAPQPNVLGGCSFIDGSNRQYNRQGTGCLSIKTFAGGAALYNVGRGRFRVDEHSYLLLNQNQPYEMALGKILWVQIELPQVKKDGAAKARATLEPACFGFQLLNAAIEAFGQAVAQMMPQVGNDP
jgi:hypothetical protein